jgi:hypothetical protein
MTLADTRVYLDIEGTPQDRTYYLIGVHAISGERESRATYWADTTSKHDEIRIFVDLLDHLSQYPEYTLLHFGTYETTALQRMRKRMGEPYCGRIDNALGRCVNVLSVITAHVYFPTYSNSLKDIGSFLGHQWSDPSSTGTQTLVWRSRWLSDHDTASKAKLIQYNSEDCAGLRRVVEFVEQVIASGPAGPFRDQRGTEVERTSGLSAKRDGWSIFGETKFVLDEFRAINKLSYFDYQREKVYARAGTYRKRRTTTRSRVKLQPNETVPYRASRCSSCGNRDIAAVSRREHEVVDLRFTRGGVKRWITRHQRWRYRCKRCGTQFLPAAIRDHRKPPKYGRGLVSWCMYQLLVGGQSINRIHRSLADLFGLSVPNTAVYLFKRAVAAYFEGGYERILKDLIKGKLIHIDETTINLQKDKGYVWVLASPSSVYFFYRDSREGSFLADMLRKFRGVLVSDFFTAYDSLDVPQQRCLIHLMRDMNEDLLKYPYDDQLKSIAIRFSSLLKEIVDTIDRYGLKRWHLNKHNVSAMRFCDWVSDQQFTSEAAGNYVRRFKKYRNHLFRFLGYDGVPWNNNCAEHAIKRFAKFRRTSNGVVTEETISDYLVMLSICLTCEYRGIDFLKVLLGKAKGDYGFGPQKSTPLRLRATRGEPALRRCARAVGSDTGSLIGGETSPDYVYGTQRVNLNKVLPKIFEGFRGSSPRLRYRVVLAPDLWPVQLNQTDLEFVLSTFVHILRGKQQRALILSARNFRFDKTDPELDLTGRYVAVSLSDRGQVEQPQRPSRDGVFPTGLQEDISLDQACMLARMLGGAASVKLARTGRKFLTTIVTTYIPQCMSKPDVARTHSDQEPLSSGLVSSTS